MNLFVSIDDWFFDELSFQKFSNWFMDEFERDNFWLARAAGVVNIALQAGCAILLYLNLGMWGVTTIPILFAPTAGPFILCWILRPIEQRMRAKPDVLNWYRTFPGSRITRISVLLLVIMAWVFLVGLGNWESPLFPLMPALCFFLTTCLAVVYFFGCTPRPPKPKKVRVKSSSMLPQGM